MFFFVEREDGFREGLLFLNYNFKIKLFSLIKMVKFSNF